MSAQTIFWDILVKLQKVLLLNDEAIAGMFKLPLSEYLRLKRLQNYPAQYNLAYFCERLNLSSDSFFTGEIDYIQVQNYFLGNYKELPTRYSYGPFSKARTIINCLEYLENKYGVNARISLLRNLQIDARFFNSPERVINLNVLTDICFFLRAHSFTDEDFIGIGEYSYEVNKNTALGQIFSSHNSVHDLFEEICSTLSVKFDENFNYSISKIASNEIYIQSKPTQKACELLNSKLIGNDTICLTKLGVFGTFPKYLGIKNSKAVKTKSLYQGSGCNEYKITF